MRPLVIGIDASNLRSGGAITHLSQLLRKAEPAVHGIGRIVVWGGELILPTLPERDWLEKVSVPALDRPLLHRLLWQQFQLPAAIRASGIDGLFSPGGVFPRCLPVPGIGMSQNMLPFEPEEAARFGGDWRMRLKFWLLHRGQVRDFQRAAGIIFLTQYAKQTVIKAMPAPPVRTAVIPHGLEPRFFLPLRPAERTFSEERPFRVLYVSIVDVYKHQSALAEAAALLRQVGRPIQVDFIGPAYQPALDGLRATMRAHDPEGRYLRYQGKVPFDALHGSYQGADTFAFPSSCENLPNILLEAMAAGLPIACADRGPMPEVLGDAGRYFDPENPVSIADALQGLMDAPEQRTALAEAAQSRARAYSWERCAAETLAFVASCVREASKSP